jgi:hypothetical protein
VGWGAVGALAAVGFASVASIGLLLLGVAALLALAFLAARVRGEPWALLGAGAALAMVGVMSLPWRSCPPVSPTVVSPPGPGESDTYSCGGIHPAVWFTLALTAAGAAVGALWHPGRSTRQRASGDG